MIAIARAGVALAAVTFVSVSAVAALQAPSRSAPANTQRAGDSAIAPSARTGDIARVFGSPPPGASTTTTHFDMTSSGGSFGSCAPCGFNCINFATVDVSGLSGTVWDVDARASAGGGSVVTLSLDLWSPAGTVVQLVSKMGCAGSGEIYDDSSAVLATDVDLSSSGFRIAPQGALGQLIGEDPNGTWQLFVTDDVCTCLFGSGCGGVWDFSLDITTLDSPLTQTPSSFTNATPASIPTQGTVTSDLTVSGAGQSLCDVNLWTFIEHTRSSDLNISLTSPAGTTVKLVTRVGASSLKTRGSSGVFNGSLWDDQATPSWDATNYPYVNNTVATPIIGEGDLSRFIGEDPNGIWQLTIQDSAVLVGGTLTSWSLELTTCELAEPGTSYCTGDGLDTVLTAECPCGNVGDPGRGCANSNSLLGGAHLTATGTTSPNTIVFTCEGMPNNSLATFWRGSMNNPTGMVFHDGVQCVAGAIIRFGQQVVGQDGNPPYTIASGTVALGPGTTRYYQTHYRNPNAGFCPPGLFNLSNGYVVTW